MVLDFSRHFYPLIFLKAMSIVRIPDAQPGFFRTTGYGSCLQQVSTLITWRKAQISGFDLIWGPHLMFFLSICIYTYIFYICMYFYIYCPHKFICSGYALKDHPTDTGGGEGGDIWIIWVLEIKSGLSKCRASTLIPKLSL